MPLSGYVFLHQSVQPHSPGASTFYPNQLEEANIFSSKPIIHPLFHESIIGMHRGVGSKSEDFRIFQCKNCKGFFVGLNPIRWDFSNIGAKINFEFTFHIHENLKFDLNKC